MMPEARVAPPLAPAGAARIARELYGIDGAARSLPGEYDDNFLVGSSDSQRFVLKVMHPAREDSFVDMQCRALKHLAARAPHLALPRVISTREGQLYGHSRVEGGASRLVWLLSFLPGHTLATVKPHSSELLASLAEFLAEMDLALLDFSHPATDREIKWDLSLAARAREYLSDISDPRRRALAERFLNLFETEAVSHFAHLRRSVIYGDANDHNVLVSSPWPRPRRVVSIIDFGDMHAGFTVGEPAIAAAYAALGKEDPLVAASTIVAAYHRVLALNEHEIAAFYPLMCARLAFSVVNSAHRKELVPDDPYITVTETPAWEALERLDAISPRLAHYTFRAACGLPAVAGGEKVHSWLTKNSAAAAPVMSGLREGNCVALDFSVGSTFLGANPANAHESLITPKIKAEMRAANAQVAVGRYNEARTVYSSALFAGGPKPTDERRTVHLGIDLFADPGAPVAAPFDGTVNAFADNRTPLDYGPVAILRHEADEGAEFFTLYGHLSRESLASMRVGDRVSRGQIFARIGNTTENGGWSPHLHFQIILDLLDLSTDFPGVAFVSQREVFTSLSPDPNLILGIPEARLREADASFESTVSARKRLLGQNLSVSYDRPLKIVRGWRQYLYDDTGRAYLDMYNNVPIVGHSHPRVTQAASEQLALLNTNTRYLHDNVLRYAERLIALLPASLKVCYFVNSGSEANELALRMARALTRREDVIVLEHAYHGHTSTLIDISPYKFSGPGGAGRKPWVHVAPIADEYRGLYRRGERELGRKYAAHIGQIVKDSEAEGRPVGAFIAETLPSVAGQVVFPDGYLAEAYKHVRAGGGVCIADEVQVGFGRLGTHFWGFETQSVVPDIVVLGKSIGNGFPLAAVITTAEVASSFANGMEFFSTFGGNPVACAAGLAVLDVLRDEKLQQNALVIGNKWMNRLNGLRAEHPIIGDVRGFGLFLGIDLVNDQTTRAPATKQASYVVNRLRDTGILAGTDGPEQNVIKLRPPLIISESDTELFTSELEEILREDAAQPRSR